LTEAAREVVERARSLRSEELALVIGNGCCDSTAPFLFGGHVPGPNELLVGRVEDLPVYLDANLAGSFAGVEVVVDARDDPQPDSFSCEAEFGKRLSLERLPALPRRG
jgi:uncharacterized protein (DUF779 family)